MTAKGKVGVLFTYVDKGKASRERSDLCEELDIPVIWDSGAFSAWNSGAVIDWREHGQWVIDRQKAGSKARHLALDAIGDHTQTRVNYVQQRDLGADVEPTFHYGLRLDEVDWRTYAGSKWVNLGGLVPLSRKAEGRKKACRFVAAVMKELGPDHHYHGLGMTYTDVSGVVPLDGADSGLWLFVPRYRRLPLFFETIGEWREYAIQMSGPRTHYDVYWKRTVRDGDLLRKEWGLGTREMLDVSQETARYLTVLSAKRYADWCSRIHDKEVTVYLAGGSTVTEEMVKEMAR